MRWLIRAVCVFSTFSWVAGTLWAGGLEPPLEPPPGGLCIEGVLSAEGVECPALRAQGGTLYTLSGDLGRFRVGDRVRACGQEALVSICMQGRTLNLSYIGEGRE